MHIRQTKQDEEHYAPHDLADFTKWNVTDFAWPDDDEYFTVSETNKQIIMQRGVNVINESVDVMNILTFLASKGIDASDVVLAVIHGMCCRTGVGRTDYSATQSALGIPPRNGPITLAFAALTAALPQATVMVSATSSRKQDCVQSARIICSNTRPVICRTVKHPDAINGIKYTPEANQFEGRHFIAD